MPEIVVTGAAGFLGRHLGNLLKDRDAVGVDLNGMPNEYWSNGRIATTGDGLAKSIKELRPEIVIHTAFINKKPVEWSINDYIKHQIDTDTPLFTLCAESGIRLILVSSSGVYGATGDREIIDESCPREPVSEYGIVKFLQEILAQHYSVKSGLQLVIARIFNFIGPGQKKKWLLPDWISQVVAIERGEAPVLKVFSLATYRDFVDVRDAAGGLLLLADNFKPGEIVNIASNESVGLKEIGAFLQSHSPRKFEIVEIDNSARDVDILRQKGSYEKIHREYGWEPKIVWQQSVLDLWKELSGAII